ncbi:MAG: VCBS repeat-containing protein [Deltaproteobacteria bacterium]|nr:VCBS repeat-containing protein [Deltaproteobacteria bacterium]
MNIFHSRSKALLLSLSILAYFAGLPAAIAEQGGFDFDGDGNADLVGYEIQRDGSPNEIALTYQASSSGEVTRDEFGRSSEMAVPADYDGDGITDLAVVGPDENDQLEWRIKLSSQEEEQVRSLFGQLGGTILAGCRFDGDAISDRTIFFGERYLSIEKSIDLSVVTIDLGVTGIEDMTCGDITGDGIDEVIGYRLISSAARRKKASSSAAGRPFFYAWDAASGSIVLEQQFGDSVGGILAADIDGDGIKEIGYSKKKRNASKQIQFLKSGQTVTFTFPKFTRATAMRSPAGGPDGIFLKGKKDDLFYKVPSLSNPAVYEAVMLNDTENLLSGVNFGQPGPLKSKEPACQVHHESTDGTNGFLWKPVSDTNGLAVVILPEGVRLRKVRIVKNSQTVESLYFAGNANGGRDHWRSRRRASAFDSNITIMGVRGGLVHCWLVSDPLQRFD